VAAQSPQNPSELPGNFRSRVFIGGSYRTSTPDAPLVASRQTLDELERLVQSLELHPVVADQFRVDEPDAEIHRDAIFLLHACRFAIFELSGFSGALMELERSVDFGTNCLILYHDPEGKGWRLSRMLSSFAVEHAARVRLFGYTHWSSAIDSARNWLEEMLRLRHARR